MALAVGSSAEISSAAHLPEGIAAGAIGGEAATLLRIEGFGPSVAYRAAAVKDLLKAAGPIDELPGEASKALWRDIRDCTPFADGTQRPIWRVSMAPSEAHRMTLALRMEVPAEAFYDWQGGLIWLRMQADPEAELLRALVKKFGGGHAMLVRASPSHRASLPVFEPQPPALAALSARLKGEFDPRGLLNPGRMEA
jgi:glycolate oxidase FAD binding subunit